MYQDEFNRLIDEMPTDIAARVFGVCREHWDDRRHIILMIKEIRGHSGLGLKDAKIVADYVSYGGYGPDTGSTAVRDACRERLASRAGGDYETKPDEFPEPDESQVDVWVVAVLVPGSPITVRVLEELHYTRKSAEDAAAAEPGHATGWVSVHKLKG